MAVLDLLLAEKLGHCQGENEGILHPQIVLHGTFEGKRIEAEE
jgi:hypothetical protein